MDPRKLRKLLEILTEFGVKQYQTEELHINMDTERVAAPDGKPFSMDDYTGSGNEDPVELGPEFTDEQILHWSSGA
jgi:hypothetical protein